MIYKVCLIVAIGLELLLIHLIIESNKDTNSSIDALKSVCFHTLTNDTQIVRAEKSYLEITKGLKALYDNLDKMVALLPGKSFKVDEVIRVNGEFYKITCVRTDDSKAEQKTVTLEGVKTNEL